ncbi:cadherin-like domain-containing protein [Neoroseomonas soli]|uniref:Cadherin-like domain-containing protein n=1 Tax=Neoroseomonas soli TaxID=1081025 RepID=A0A9X9X2Z0_9PROT|nr:cadherin-like domain-containing protein [Neoroseomonas soli]MBR0673769.1 hypothetical protein [Neoroseomonas soli]
MADMTFTIAGGPGVEVHVVEEGGALRFTVSILGTGGLTADLRGLFFQVADESLLQGLRLTEGGAAVTEFRSQEDGVIDLGQGANMQGAASAFDVGVEIGTAGIGHDDWQTATFVLSHATEALSLDLIAAMDFGVRLTSVGVEGGERSDGLKLVGTAPEASGGNGAPVAANDSAFTDEDTRIDIAVLGNDSDPDGDTLTVSLGSATSSLGAAISVNPDGSISYDPSGSAKLGALNTDQEATDSFTYTITDPDGATSTATVEVTVGGITDVIGGFLGKTLTYTYDYLPGTANSFDFSKEVTVGDGTEVPEMIGGGIFDVASLDITDTQLIIDYYQASFWESGGFNGFRITDTLGVLSEITGVTIRESNMLGFDTSDISVTTDSITVDWAGLSFTADTRIVLDVSFA